MEYISTRDKSISVTSAEAIVCGLSADGGLFVPNEFPKVSFEKIEEMAKKSYNQRAAYILSLFLTDFTIDEINECVDKSYNKQKFETESIAPTYKLSNGVYFLELWHGPTCAFKDMALQILPHLLTKSIKKTAQNKTVVILVATSGDTGKAALEGFCDVEGTKIIVFYPENGVSEIQKLQMVTQKGDNVFVASINGNFDDAQNGVKKIFTDDDYNKNLNDKGFMLSSANSINWGRLVPQIVYYFSAYADLLNNNEISPSEKVNFVVPTGNFGNILAAYYAKLMGLPINKLICASNENNVLTDFIKTGSYNKNRDFKLTASPSMDILISSNLERFLFDIIGNDSMRIKEWMKELNDSGKYKIHDLTKQKIKDILWADFATDIETKNAIKETEEKSSYLMDTHTAVAKNVYDKYVLETNDNTKTIIVSTASPFKFNKSVVSALFGDDEYKNLSEFELLSVLAEKCNMKVPSSLSELNELEVRFNNLIEKEQMQDAVYKALKI